MSPSSSDPQRHPAESRILLNKDRIKIVHTILLFFGNILTAFYFVVQEFSDTDISHFSTEIAIIGTKKQQGIKLVVELRKLFEGFAETAF